MHWICPRKDGCSLLSIPYLQCIPIWSQLKIVLFTILSKHKIYSSCLTLTNSVLDGKSSMCRMMPVTKYPDLCLLLTRKVFINEIHCKKQRKQAQLCMFTCLKSWQIAIQPQTLVSFIFCQFTSCILMLNNAFKGPWWQSIEKLALSPGLIVPMSLK